MYTAVPGYSYPGTPRYGVPVLNLVIVLAHVLKYPVTGIKPCPLPWYAVPGYAFGYGRTAVQGLVLPEYHHTIF